VKGSSGGMSRETKALWLNAGGIATVLTYGVINWDYFQTTPQASAEGWFGENTKSGGADKLGHFWSSYATSHLFSYFYEKFGYGQEKANLYGALSGAGLQTIVEIGDSFSGDFGFSYEDFIMNLGGAGAAYILGKYPAFAEKIAFRIEYVPESLSDLGGDIFTDYENQRYLIALKLDGFETFRNSYLGYLELQAGYFTRGFEQYQVGQPDHRQRSAYFGIGLNIDKIVRKYYDTRIFDYFQMPFTTLRTDIDID
jgi:hypothetical protein